MIIFTVIEYNIHMKIRSDFVSNSSSSSFIISKCDITKTLSKQDFIDAICDLYDGSDGSAGHTHICEILDKTIKEDNDKINSDFTEWLDHWHSRFMYIAKNGKFWTDPMYNQSEYFKSNYDKWYDFYEVVRDTYNELPWHWNPSVTENYIYNHETKKFEWQTIDENLYKILNDTFTSLGIISHRKAIQSDIGRILIHFNDNEIYNLKGMDTHDKHKEILEETDDYDRKRNEEIRNSTYETESYSAERFCEILVNWFKEKGKLPEETTWEDFAESIIGCCLHEG